MDFIAFPKMARVSREMIITEKLDGTNAQVCIADLSEWDYDPEHLIFKSGNIGLLAGSRTRWVTPQDDNCGFARWCAERADELLTLGVGRHFGEWWGKGIQRGYGLDEKRFSLFNVTRWGAAESRPGCCHVVPVLYQGMFDTAEIDLSLKMLALGGSLAAPGYMRPEGVIAFHVAGNFGMKKTIERDDVPKGQNTGRP